MELSKYWNTQGFLKLYNGFLEDGGYINFATYFNDKETYNIKTVQKNYLNTGDINFEEKVRKYEINFPVRYTYNERSYGDTTDYMPVIYILGTPSNYYDYYGCVWCSIDDSVLFSKNSHNILPYRFMWFEYDSHDSNLNVSIPNQGHTNMNVYINELGEVIINNDLE